MGPLIRRGGCRRRKFGKPARADTSDSARLDDVQEVENDDEPEGDAEKPQKYGHDSTPVAGLLATLRPLFNSHKP